MEGEGKLNRKNVGSGVGPVLAGGKRLGLS